MTPERIKEPERHDPYGEKWVKWVFIVPYGLACVYVPPLIAIPIAIAAVLLAVAVFFDFRDRRR